MLIFAATFGGLLALRMRLQQLLPTHPVAIQAMKGKVWFSCLEAGIGQETARRLAGAGAHVSQGSTAAILTVMPLPCELR